MSEFLDQDQYDENTKNEKKAQEKMDAFYIRRGLIIVSRTGNYQRDVVLEKNGKTIKVEEKFRDKDWGDLLVEIIQDVTQPSNLGWFYTETPDLLNYVICTTDWEPINCHTVVFTKFKNWFYSYLKEHKHPEVVISPEGMGLTLNIAIPWAAIPQDMHKFFVLQSLP